MKKHTIIGVLLVVGSVSAVAGCSHPTPSASNVPAATGAPGAANTASAHYPSAVARQMQQIQSGNGSSFLKQHAMQQWQMQFGHGGPPPGSTTK